MNNFFSIITVTKNNLSGLTRTYASIQKQTYANFEWVVIDGSDNSETSEFLKTTPAIFTSEPDYGLYDAMNKGLKKILGRYVLFLNSGDTLSGLQTLRIIHDKQNDEDFIYGDALENGRIKKSRPHTYYKYHMFTHHQSMLYRRDKIGALTFNPDYKIAADYDFTVRFLSQTTTALYIPLPICFFEQGGLSQTHAALGRKEQFEIRKKHKLLNLYSNFSIRILQTVRWIFSR